MTSQFEDKHVLVSTTKSTSERIRVALERSISRSQNEMIPANTVLCMTSEEKQIFEASASVPRADHYCSTAPISLAVKFTQTGKVVMTEECYVLFNLDESGHVKHFVGLDKGTESDVVLFTAKVLENISIFEKHNFPKGGYWVGSTERAFLTAKTVSSTLALYQEAVVVYSETHDQRNGQHYWVNVNDLRLARTENWFQYGVNGNRVAQR